MEPDIKTVWVFLCQHATPDVWHAWLRLHPAVESPEAPDAAG